MKALRAAVALGLVLSATALTACGSSSDDSSTSSTGSATSSGGGSSTQAPSGEPIKIGWINPGTGTGVIFPESTAAAKAAVDYINDSLGGVDGRPVELIACDSEGTPESDAKCAQDVLSKKPLVLTLNQVFNMAGVFQAEAPTGIPIVGAVNTGPDEATAKNTIWLSGGATGYLMQQGKWINENLKPKTVGVLYDNPAAAAGLDLLLGDLKKGGATVKSRLIDPKAADSLAAYKSVVSDDTDLVIGLLGAESSCIGLAKARQSQQDDVNVFTTDVCLGDSVAKAAGPAIKGWYIGDINFARESADPTPDWKTFQEQIDKYADGKTDSKSPGSFAVIMTVYDVIKKLGADAATPAAIEKSFRTQAGDVFLDGTYDCSKAAKELPNLCVDQFQVWQITEPGGPLTYAPNGKLFHYNDGGTRTGG